MPLEAVWVRGEGEAARGGRAWLGRDYQFQEVNIGKKFRVEFTVEEILQKRLKQKVGL